jgi:hypothetical protein
MICMHTYDLLPHQISHSYLLVHWLYTYIIKNKYRIRDGLRVVFICGNKGCKRFEKLFITQNCTTLQRGTQDVPLSEVRKATMLVLRQDNRKSGVGVSSTVHAKFHENPSV